MKRIIGRILVKETNAGIPNLVVAAFDSELDGSVKEGASRETFRIDSTLVNRLGTRLGSVLTDERGNFVFGGKETDEISCECRPDLVIVIFAPEDSIAPERPFPLPPEQRILHISRLPRTDVGPSEAYVIRLLQAQIDKFRIPVGRELDAERSAGSDLSRILTSLEHTWNLKDKLLEATARRAKRDAEAAAVRSTNARKKFRQLSAIPARLRDHPLLAKSQDDVATKHAEAIAASLERLQNYAGEIQVKTKNGELRSLGAGRNGKVKALDLANRIMERNGSVDLVKRRTLADAAQDPKHLANKLLEPDPVPLPPPQDRSANSFFAITKGDENSGDPTSEGKSGSTPSDDTPSDNATGNASAKKNALGDIVLDRVIGQIQALQSGDTLSIEKRPEQDEIQSQLDKLKLKGGPSDVPAFHDFHVLEVAFRDVWIHAFSSKLRSAAEALYVEYTRIHDEAGLPLPPVDAVDDITQLKEFVGGLGFDLPGQIPGHSDPYFIPGAGGIDISTDVVKAFPQASVTWSYLSRDQQILVIKLAANKNDAGLTDQERSEANQLGTEILRTPVGARGRIEKLILHLGALLAEPYAFDVFAPGTYNFGIMLTYRQEWAPVAYQVGRLASTIPLAPGEIRKYSKRQVTRKSRAEKEIEKSQLSTSAQTTETNRAEVDIMTRASNSSNFKLTAHGSFNIGIGNIDSTSEFSLNQEQASQTNKRNFHEATVKAAQDYRLERSTEIDTSTSTEIEEVSSGEISNPNNELTVTYLFYELERRYQITENIHRVQPVILVAQDVPGPHEIDEAWLLSYQWILSRVLLDNSLRPALDYLNSGFAGDEVALQIQRAHWEGQRDAAAKLEAQLSAQIELRNQYRDSLIQLTKEDDNAKAQGLPTALKVLTLGDDPNDIRVAAIEANRREAETRLQYVEQAIADAQDKLNKAVNAFQEATKQYAAALQRQYSRRVAIDQLRIHVKQNILFYMQAIWDHEPPDQRFFRLYQQKVTLPEPTVSCSIKPIVPKFQGGIGNLTGFVTTGITLGPCAPAIGGPEVDLISIADLDNPIGYKGNYIVFPLKVPTYLTTYMMSEFVDEYFGIRDPDEFGSMTIDQITSYVSQRLADPNLSDDVKRKLRADFTRRITEARPVTDQIIVPTGQLFIEALPGNHTLLEDFKLLHRVEDVKKVIAEVRHAELENLRLASRLIEGEREDPDIEKKVIVENGTDVTVDTN